MILPPRLEVVITKLLLLPLALLLLELYGGQGLRITTEGIKIESTTPSIGLAVLVILLRDNPVIKVVICHRDHKRRWLRDRVAHLVCLHHTGFLFLVTPQA
jgi:hypothetical protein